MKALLSRTGELVLGIVLLLVCVWSSSTGFYFGACPHLQSTLTERMADAAVLGLIQALYVLPLSPAAGLLGLCICVGGSWLLRLCHSGRRFVQACAGMLALSLCLLPIGYLFALAASAQAKCSFGW